MHWFFVTRLVGRNVTKNPIKQRIMRCAQLIFTIAMSLCQWYMPTRAQTCGTSAREFVVGNCTACPTRDHTRGGGITMAECSLNHDVTTLPYTCRCLDYPADASMPMVWYYPQPVTGNAAHSCANAWSWNPALFSVLVIVPAGISLYALAHLTFVVVASGMCSCGRERHRCTTTIAAALVFGFFELGYVIQHLWRVVAQGEVTIGSSGAAYNAWIFYCLDAIGYWMITSVAVGVLLFFVSVVGTVYPGRDMAARRRNVTLPFGVLFGVWMLAWILLTVVPRRVDHAGVEVEGILWLIFVLLAVLVIAYIGVFIFIMHRTMLQVVT